MEDPHPPADKPPVGPPPPAEIGLLAEFWLFIKEEKKWWLGPLIAVLLLLGLLLLFAETSPFAPFFYPLF